jgi:lauroyl/myristoyl acyltransferase
VSLSKRVSASGVRFQTESTVSLVDAGDVARAALFALLAPCAWSVPPRSWPLVCGVLANGWARIRVLENPHWRAIVSRALGDRDIGLSPTVVRERTLANNLEFMLQLLRMWRPRRGRWYPEVELVGREHIDAGLRQGRGVILWVHRLRPFVHFVALAKAGLEVCRPSGKYHGEFYRSHIGRYWLNPLQTRLEDRYCARVVVGDRAFGHLREVQRRLRGGAIVSMYADYLEGTRNIDVPFLEGRLSMSTQAVSLAVQSDSHILPVFPISDAAGKFRVIVEPSLDIAGNDRASVDAAVTRHARRLEWYVLRYPDQWQGWDRVNTEATNASGATAR